MLFTDIDGFTALTERSDPKALIALLDAYLERVGGLVVSHGGMVDKIVGDSIHAIFNAPLDLPDHAGMAVRCALAIKAATEAFAAEPQVLAMQLGRTRIGIETGRAVVGDVGGAARLDYTAHGDVINAAARLEAANKELGTSILVGSGTRAAARIGRCDRSGRLPCAGFRVRSMCSSRCRAENGVCDHQPVKRLLSESLGRQAAGFSPLPSHSSRSGRLTRKTRAARR